MKTIPRVDEWIPSKEDSIVKYDGKLVIVPFDTIFKNTKIGILNAFNILKDSYVSRLDIVTHYINYFIKFYDEDNELMLAYLKLKAMADNKDQHITIQVFIQFVYNVLLSESMRKKIVDMVEDNYYIDVSSDDGKKYNESLEFTEEHAKILMQMSTAMKLMIPIMFHYINKIKYSKEKERTKNRKKNHHFSYKSYLYRFYAGLFDIFGGENVDIYNKLWISTWSRINVHHQANKTIWEQKAIYGTTTVTHMDELLRDKIICETMFKYQFNKNIVSFNHVILKNQLGFFICERYATNRIEISSKKDVSGLSGLDKLEMNSTKLDESVAILSAVNIKHTIKRIEKQLRYKVSADEIDYYAKHITITKFQVQLCQYFYARTFGGYRDLSLLNRRNYFKLLILLKKRLRLQGMIYLPDILTANIDGRLNARTIRNDKFLTKIESSDLYRSIMENKYSTLESIGKGDIIINTLSTLINTKFTIVDYDNPDRLGETIEVNQDMISDEFLSFINQL